MRTKKKQKEKTRENNQKKNNEKQGETRKQGKDTDEASEGCHPRRAEKLNFVKEVSMKMNRNEIEAIKNQILSTQHNIIVFYHEYYCNNSKLAWPKKAWPC